MPDIKVKLEDLSVGDTFKEYPNSKFSPLYTIVKKDDNGILVKSSVTCGSICKLKDVWVNDLEKYIKSLNISEDDMKLDEMINSDIYKIYNEVGGQDGMYDNFPISRVYRGDNNLRVYYLTSYGGVAIIQIEEYFQILVLGEDDGWFFLNSKDMYCSFYGNKLGFVTAISEALSLFNNVS